MKDPAADRHCPNCGIRHTLPPLYARNDTVTYHCRECGREWVEYDPESPAALKPWHWLAIAAFFLGLLLVLVWGWLG